MQIFLSTITEIDYAGIREVIQDAYDDEGSVSDRIERLRKRPEYNYELEVVAKTDGYKLIGHVFLNEVTMTYEDETYYVLVLESLAVLKDYREQGIAQALLQAAEERARAAGYTTLITLDTPGFFEEMDYEPLEAYDIHFNEETRQKEARVKFLWEQLTERPHGVIASFE